MVRPLLKARRVTDVDVVGAQPAGGILFQAVSQLEISATYLREEVRRGRSPRYLLPAAVADYIRDMGLYRDGGGT